MRRGVRHFLESSYTSPLNPAKTGLDPQVRPPARFSLGSKSDSGATFSGCFVQRPGLRFCHQVAEGEFGPLAASHSRYEAATLGFSYRTSALVAHSRDRERLHGDARFRDPLDVRFSAHALGRLMVSFKADGAAAPPRLPEARWPFANARRSTFLGYARRHPCTSSSKPVT